MRILDRQRYWAYLKAYLICFSALVGMYVVFDAFSNIDEFSEVSDGTVDLLRRMGRYYLIRMSLFYDRLFGVIGMMAAIFTVTWMQRNNEMVAMLAAGISTPRAIRPVLISAVLVSTLAVANQELLVPRFATEFQLPPDDDGLRQLKVYSRTDVNEIVIHGKWAYRDTMTVAPFDATLPESRFHSLHNLEAKEARYIPEDDFTSPLRGGWLLRGARLFPAGSEPDGTLLLNVSDDDVKQFPPSRDKPEMLTGASYFLRSNIDFETATRSLQWFNFASTPALVRTLTEPISQTERTEIGVFLHTRVMRPALSFCLLMLSLPIVLGSNRGGMFINLGLSLATSAIFYTVLFFFLYLGNNSAFGITPTLAAWAPLIGFGTLAAARWDRIRT